MYHYKNENLANLLCLCQLKYFIKHGFTNDSLKTVNGLKWMNGPISKFTVDSLYDKLIWFS